MVQKWCYNYRHRGGKRNSTAERNTEHDMKREVNKMTELLNKYLTALNRAEKMRSASIASGADTAAKSWETKIDFYSGFVYDLANELKMIRTYETVEEEYFGMKIAYHKTVVF